MLLLSVSLSKQALYSITVVSTLEQSLARAKHGLSRVFCGQLAWHINEYDCRRLNAVAPLV